MDNQKNLNAEVTVNESAQTAEDKAAAVEQAIQETSGRKKVYKDQDFYPICAIIICVFASIGQLINPDAGLTVGMFIGIIAAIIFVVKGGKQIDPFPTKAKEKKEKK